MKRKNVEDESGKRTKSSAVVVIADRTAYDVQYSYSSLE